MRELPIPFNTEMVRAILDGRKTRTMRPVKPQPSLMSSIVKLCYEKHPFSPSAFVGTPAEGRIGGEDRMGWLAEDWCGNIIGTAGADEFKPPFGLPGDRLYVRETWAVADRLSDYEPCVVYGADGATRQAWSEEIAEWMAEQEVNHGADWRPSIHMPKRAARIWLEVENVTVMRVRDITEEQALAEGAPKAPGRGAYPSSRAARVMEHRAGFINLWDAIYAPQGLAWDANPWCWSCSFRVLSTTGRPA